MPGISNATAPPDQSMPVADSAMPVADPAVAVADSAMPVADSAMPVADPAVAVADLAVVIVSYNCRDDVLAAIGSVVDQGASAAIEVVVADNDSADGTAEAIRERFPQVRVLEQGANRGFSAANNAGITATTARHVLILNPDTTVDPGTLDTLVAFVDTHPNCGVAAPRLVNPDGSDQLTARAFPTAAAAVFGRRSPLTRWFPNNPWSTKFLAGRDRVGDEPFQIDWVSGAAMVVPRSVIDHVGGFDEDFFLYWEDAEWCRRIKRAGYEVWCVPTARIVHHEGGTRDHRWTYPVARHFHTGAYLYWKKAHAPQWWNPLRWSAAGLLAARTALVVAADWQRHRRPVGVSAIDPSQLSSATEQD